MSSEFGQSLKYLLFRYVLKQPFLMAKENKFGLLYKFKTEDVVGRHIYKRGKYESHISDFLSEKFKFNEGDIALDIGANIGWYSILLNKLMPESGKIYAFEPDPLNFKLLSENIKLNTATNVVAVNNALSDKNETKKLYRYSSKNLGRHSLLDINKADYIEVEALVLDQFLQNQNIDISKVKFVKIDIEGYEYFALSGASRVLDHVQCLIGEFVPEHMERGGIKPELLINLMQNKGFRPNVIKGGEVCSISSDDLLQGSACDIIWLRVE